VDHFRGSGDCDRLGGIHARVRLGSIPIPLASRSRRRSFESGNHCDSDTGFSLGKVLASRRTKPRRPAFSLYATAAFFFSNTIGVGTMVIKITLLLSFVLLAIIEVGSTKEDRFVLRLRFRESGKEAAGSMMERPNDNTNVL